MNVVDFVAGGALALVLAGNALAQDSFGGARPASPGQTPAATPSPGLPPGPSVGPVRGHSPALGAAAEGPDYGVAPPPGLHPGPMHGQTPTRIPGGRVVSTREVVDLLRGKALLFDVLGGPEIIPNAQYAVPAHQGGDFTDRTQEEFGRYLQQVSGGDKARPLVFYCQSSMCWMSYNAALRAIRMGFTQVQWYRGGIDAWKQAGQPVQPAKQGPGPSQGQGQAQPPR